MNNDLFPRAKIIALQSLRSWLPEGHLEGDEWVCLSPTRHEKTPSFKVNINTGAWSDFGDVDAAGNDCVSCYCHIHRDKFLSKARQEGFKNVDGGAQTLAAKEILSNYDDTYFPNPNDIFHVPKVSGQKYWDGWRAVGRGIDNPPSPNESIKYLTKRYGYERQRWDGFADKKNRVLLYIVRYIDDNGKKSDIPFSLWQKGEEYRWRAKTFDGELPLYNMLDLEIRQNDPILMVEGQKCAEMARQKIGVYFCCTTFYGKLERVIWEPLRGRTVYYWFDPDKSGRAKLKKIKKLISELDVKFKAIHSPVGKKAGWDIGDAIDDGWTEEQLINHIQEPSTQTDEEFIDDTDCPVKIIGRWQDTGYFYSRKTKIVSAKRLDAINKQFLTTLVKREWWWSMFSEKTEDSDNDRMNWGAAIEHVIRMADDAPIYDDSMIRGVGAWRDNDRIIYNTGNSLLIDGKEEDLYLSDSKYVYSRDKELPYRASNPLPVEESKKILDIMKLIPFKQKTDYLMLAGWSLLAPFCGIIPWRSQVWLTGPKGAGKSWVLSNVISPLVGMFALKGNGSSSAAGIKQWLRSSTKPAILDEMESDNIKKAEDTEAKLTIFREGSSNTDGDFATLNGTSDGRGTKWIVQSMPLFCSIGAALRHGADRDRVTVIDMDKHNTMDEVRNENYQKLKKLSEIINYEWALAFHSRTMNIIDIVLETIDLFRHHVGAVTGTNRKGDQIGTLLAGAWMCSHDKVPTASEIMAWLEELEINGSESLYEKSDSALLIDEILNYKININDKYGKSQISVGLALMTWFSKSTKSSQIREPEEVNGLLIDHKEIKKELAQIGICPSDYNGELKVKIAKSHSGIKRMLYNTQWEHSYYEVLSRLEYCSDEKGPGAFAGVRKRYREIDALQMLDDIPF